MAGVEVTQAIVPDDVLLVGLAAIREHGTISAAALAMGVPRPTLQRHARMIRDRFPGELPVGDFNKPWASEARQIEIPSFRVEAPVNHDEPIEDLIARRALAYQRKAAGEDATKFIRVQVRAEGAYGILHMGDPHVDDDGCDWPTLNRHLSLIDSTPGLFAANVGDYTNNWVGRLARLYSNQGTSAAEALRLAEWLIGRVKWLYLIGGNHDAWSGAQDPIRWFASQAGAQYEMHGARLALTAPNGVEVRINARHDFRGTSQWNGAHALAKNAKMAFSRDHIYVCGHRHSAAHNTVFFEDGKHVAHAIRIGSYKRIDDYAKAGGFMPENVPACVTVVNPNARDPLGLVQVFWDVEAAADYLRFLNRPRVRVQAGSKVG